MSKEFITKTNQPEELKKDTIQIELSKLSPEQQEELKKWVNADDPDFWVRVESALALSSLFLS